MTPGRKKAPAEGGKAKKKGKGGKGFKDDGPVSSGEPVLLDVDLSVTRGQLVAVIGPVGSGKSSLLACLVGEMDLKSGRVSRQQSATLALAAQVTGGDTVQRSVFGTVVLY